MTALQASIRQWCDLMESRSNAYEVPCSSEMQLDINPGATHFTDLVTGHRSLDVLLVGEDQERCAGQSLESDVSFKQNAT